MESKPILECVKSAKLRADAADILFLHKRRASAVFRDVIGLHELAQLSLTVIDKNHQLFALSFLPAIEYQLFTKGLWIYDKVFHPSFYQQQGSASWDELYLESHFDRVQFIKEIKPNLCNGLAIARKFGQSHCIFSFATRSIEAHQGLLEVKPHLLKIGEYCLNHLKPIINDYLCDAIVTATVKKPSHLQLVVSN